MPLEKQKYNPKQKKAITFGNGPLLIIAGAGTGKTMVITERISHLILDKNGRSYLTSGFFIFGRNNFNLNIIYQRFYEYFIQLISLDFFNKINYNLAKVYNF